MDQPLQPYPGDDAPFKERVTSAIATVAMTSAQPAMRSWDVASGPSSQVVASTNLFDQHGPVLLAALAASRLSEWILRTDALYRERSASLADCYDDPAAAVLHSRVLHMQVLWTVQVHLMLLYISSWLEPSEMRLFLTAGLSPMEMESTRFTQSVLYPWMHLATRPVRFVFVPVVPDNHTLENFVRAVRRCRADASTFSPRHSGRYL